MRFHWIAEGLRKHEVQYGKLNFDAAKEAEVAQWVKEAAARRVRHAVPLECLMKIRWVLTYKESGAAIARIVVVRYQDRALGELVSSSPTMSCRNGQLVYQQAICRVGRP